MTTISKTRLFLVGLSVLLLAALLYFSDINSTVATIRQANPLYIAIGFGLWALSAVIRIYRWDYLLKCVDIHVSRSKLVPIFFSGFYLSNVTPAKSGDPIRSILLKRLCNIPFARSLPSIMVERLADIFVMVALGLIGMSFIPASDVTPYLYGTILFFFFGAVAVIYVSISKQRTLFVMRLLYRIFSFFPKIRRFENKLEASSTDLSDSFNTYKRTNWIVVLLVLSVFMWLLEGWIGKAAFLALGIDVPVGVVLAVITISTLVGVLTLLPGGIGSAEISSVLIFVSLDVATLQQATAAVLLMRFMSYWAYVAVGSLATATLK